MTTEETLETTEETPPTPVTWEDRRDQMLEAARGAEAAETATERYCEAILLVDRKQPGDFQVVEVWGEALQRLPDQALTLWQRLGRKLTTTQDFWQQIAMAHQVAREAAEGETAAIVDEAWGYVQLLRSGEADAGKARLEGLESAGDIAGQLLEMLDVASTGNWRKVERAVSDQLSALGLSDPELKIETAFRTAELAIGQGSADRAANVLQGLEKAKVATAESSLLLRLLYRDIGKWNNFINMLKSAVEETEEPELQVDYYLEMVEVYRDQMKLDAMVVKSYEAILDIDPGYSPAYDALEETYDGMRRYPDLVKLLQRRLESSQSAADKIALNLKIANVYIDKLSRHANAIEFYENILEVEPLHPESVEALKDLYDKRREWEKLVDLHRREIATLDDPGEQLIRLREVAEIATQRLRKSDLPVKVWREILEVSPEDQEAIDALEQLYRSKKDWENVAFICERKAALSEDVEEKLRYWQEIGTLFGDRLDDSEGAIRAWRQVLELDPTNARGADSLRKLLTAAGAWDDLEAFFGEREQWEELSRQLEKQVKKTDDDEETIDLLFRAARVRGEEQEQPERAVSLVEAVFETDPMNLRAATYLAPVYEEASDSIQLADMLAIQLQHIESPDERLPLLLKLARLYETEIESPDSAYIWFAKALEEHPKHAEAYDDIERVGVASQQYEDLVARLRTALEAVGEDEDLRRNLKLRIGRNLGDHLGQVDEALALFESVLAEEPESQRALAALEGLLERTGRFDELIEVNRRRLDLTQDPEEQADILLVAARIHEQNREDLPTAIEAYEHVRGLRPSDARPLIELRRLYRTVERHEDLADVLRRHISLAREAVEGHEPEMVEVLIAVDLDDDGMPVMPADAPEDAEPEVGDDGEIYVRVMRPAGSGDDAGLRDEEIELLGLWFELGEVARRELLEASEAIEAYREVLAFDIEHDEARYALEELLEKDAEPHKVACILEPAYIKREDFESLVKVLRVQLEHVSETDARFDLFVRVGLLQHEALEQLEEAFGAYRQALALKPANEDVQLALENLAETLDNHAELAQTMEEISGGIDDVVLRTMYLMKLAELHEQYLDDSDRALAYGRRALEIGREHEEVLAALEETFMRLEAWGDLVDTMRAKVELSDDPEQRLGLKLQIAEVTEGMLGNKEGAVDVYLEVVADDPENDAALAVLDRLYEELERWSDLATNLERRADLQDDVDVRDDVLCKLAQTLERHLEEPARAIDIFQDVLSRDPSNEVAIGELRGMLENLVDHAEVIAGVLLPIYEDSGDWLSQIEVKELLLRAVDDAMRRIELLHSIAGLYETNVEAVAEAAEDPEAGFRKAFETYARALPVEPTNDLTLERLHSYAEALFCWEKLVEHYEAVIEEISLTEASTAKMLLVRAAQIQKDRLEDADAAINAYARALELEPEDLSVIESLERLYEDLGRWEPLASTLMKKAGLIYDLESKKELLYKAAMIAEEMLEDKAMSIEVYRDVFDFDNNDEIALDSLERLYNETEQWSELIGVYAIKVDRSEDPEDKREIYHVLGAIQEEKLEEFADAISTHRQALDLDREDVVSLEALDRLFLRNEDYFSLLGILEREEELATEFEPKLRLRYRRGELLQRHLENIEQAIELYSSILDVDARHEDTVLALEELVEHEDFGVRAAEVLEPVYRVLEEWEKLVGVYEVLIADCEEPERKIELLGFAGEVHESALEAPQAAFDTWLRALRVDPELDAVWEQLLRLGSTYDLWEQLVERAGALLDDFESDVPQATAIVRNVATIYSELLGRSDDAIAQWRRLLEIDDSSELAMDALDGLFESEQRFEELAEILIQKIERQYEPEARIQLHYRLGLLNANFLENGEQAIEQFKEILLIEAGQPDAIQALVELFGMGIGQIEIADILVPFYRQNDAWADLVTIYLALLEHPDKSSDDRYSMLLEVASIYIDHLAAQDESSLANAIMVYGLALKERPDDALALAQINGLATRTGYWNEAISAYQDAIPQTDDAHTRQELLWRAAKAYFDQLSAADEAELYFLKFLGFDGDETDHQALQAARAERQDPRTSTSSIVHAAEHEEDLAAGLSSEEPALDHEYEPGNTEHGFPVDLDDMDLMDDSAPAMPMSTPASAVMAIAAPDDFEATPEPDDFDAGPEPEIERRVLAFLAGIDPEAIADVVEHERALYSFQCLDAIYESRGDWAELAEVLPRESKLAFSEDDEVGLLLRLGQTQHRLGRTDEALDSYQEVLSINPVELDALESLVSLYETLEDWDALYTTLELKADAVSDVGSRARIWTRMANVAAARLDRPDDAIDMLYQVIGACEDDPGGQLGALQGLEVLYGKAEDWEEYISTIERQIPLYGEDNEGRLEAFRRLGRLCIAVLEDDMRGLGYWRHAQAVNPEDFETLCALKALYEQMEEHALLADTIRSLLYIEQLDPEETLAHYVQLGLLLMNELNEPEQSIEVWEAIRGADPDHTLSLESLNTLYREVERWEDTARVLEHQARLAEDQETYFALLIEAAQVWGDKAEQFDEALAALQQVLNVEMFHPEGYAQLEALLTQFEKWPEMISMYMDRVEITQDSEERLEYRRRAARIAEQRLDQAEFAFDVMIGALDESWRDKTLARDLEELAEKTGRWDLLIRSYNNILEELQGSPEGIVLHNTFGRWYYLRVDPPDYPRSWEHFQKVLAVDQKNLDAFEGLAEIYRRTENFDELISIQTIWGGLLKPEVEEQRVRKVELYCEQGQLWEEKKQDVDEAIKAYRESLKHGPTYLPSIEELKRIFTDQQRWEELVEVLEMRTGALDPEEPAEIISTLFAIGDLWEERLDSAENAAKAFYRVLEIEEEHGEALQRLESLLIELERWEDLLKVYDLQAMTASEAEQIGIFAKMASVYEEQLDDPAKAIESVQQITLISPENFSAIGNLERLYANNQMWEDLADTLQNHIMMLGAGQERATLQVQRGEVFRDHLDEPHDAVSCFREAHEDNPKNEAALHALADIYAALGEWRAMIDELNKLIHVIAEREANLPGDQRTYVPLVHRAGVAFIEQLDDIDSAENYFLNALETNPGYIPSLDALKSLYDQREDHNRVIQMLRQKVDYIRDLTERADIFCEIGQIYEVKLDNPINAIDYYQRTVELSPDNVLAARPLAAMYIREHKWARAETLLEQILTKIGAQVHDLDGIHEVYYWLGLSNEQLGQDAKALQYYREAFEHDPNHLPTLLGMGRLMYRSKDYERAYQTFNKILVEYADSLSNEDHVELYFQAGEIKRALEEPDDAQQLFHRALEFDPAHGPSLAAMIDLCEEQEHWEHVVHYKRHRLNIAEDDTERFAELVSIGDIWRNEINNGDEAIKAYEEAMATRPKSKVLLHKLLELHTTSKQWDDAISVLKRLIELERSGAKRAKFLYTIAVLYRDQLEDDDKAVEHFNATLDEDVNELKSFEAIDRILTGKRDWQELQRNYRKMIKRVYDNDEGQFDDTKFLLWYGLGETYRSRLAEYDSATSAFLQAASLQGENIKIHRILADLFVRQSRFDEAIKTYHTMIGLPLARGEDGNQRNAEFYHALFKLYINTRQYDRAWGVCNLASYLRLLTDEEKAYHEKYLPQGLPQTQGRFTNEIWSLTYHPLENLRIGNIMAILQAHCRDLYAWDLKRVWGLKKRNLLALDQPVLFCKIYSYLAGILGVIPAPRLYLNNEQPLGMVSGNVDPPAFIIGADMMQGRTQTELAFIIARRLALSTPQHYLGGLRLPTENLKFLVMGAIQANTSTNVKAIPENLVPVVKSLQKMPPPVRVDLGKMMRPVLDGRVEVNMSKWLKGIDHTANRVGLLLCGDLNVAMRSVKNDSAPISKLTTAEKERDLIEFCISDEYFELRQRLGLSVD